MKAITLIELIFVLIIIGILTSVGFYSAKPNYLLQDGIMVQKRLLQARYEGIMYNKQNFDNFISSKIGCVALDELNRSEDGYRFHSSLEINDSLNPLCFDSFARPHKSGDSNKTSLDTLVTQKSWLLSIRYNNKELKFFVLPESGYVIIE